MSYFSSYILLQFKNAMWIKWGSASTKMTLSDLCLNPGSFRLLYHHRAGGMVVHIFLLLTGILSTATLYLDNTNFPIELMMKLKFRELKQLTYGHTARHKSLLSFHCLLFPISSPGSTASLLFWNTPHVCNLTLATSHQVKGHQLLKQTVLHPGRGRILPMHQ